MKWFEILKNIQISSQSGKTKEIKLPPKEDDEDCVGKFYAVQEKLRNLQIDGVQKFEQADDTIFFYENGKEPEYFQNMDMQIVIQPDMFGNVPNEIFCLAIEQYESLFRGGHKFSQHGTFRIITDRGKIGTMSSNYLTSYDDEVYNIIIAKGDDIDDSPYSAASIFIRFRKYRKGRYGEDGFVNEELVDKLRKEIDRALVF